MYVSVCQGVKACTVPPVERFISVSPSCQPAVIEVSYVNGDGQTVSVENNQDVIGVCGDTIRRLSKSLVDGITLLSRLLLIFCSATGASGPFALDILLHT